MIVENLEVHQPAQARAQTEDFGEYHSHQSGQVIALLDMVQQMLQPRSACWVSEEVSWVA